MMSVSNQMMKGLLDGAILGLIAKGETCLLYTSPSPRDRG